MDISKEVKEMGDLKTTITGVVTGILTLLSGFGVIIPEAYTPVIIAIGVALVSYFAKDVKKDSKKE